MIRKCTSRRKATTGKNLFRHHKTRYRGLSKNTAQLFTLFAFANLVLADRRFTITESRNPY